MPYPGNMAQGAASINRIARSISVRGSHLRRLRGTLAALAFASFSTACSPMIENRGYVPDSAALDKIQPGSQSRNDVTELLGTPSSIAQFSDDTWIYIQRKTSTVAFFEPTVLEQNVVVVRFDDAGLVRDVHRYTLEDGKFIDPVTRKTPAPGRELSFLEQLIGNIGKFAGADQRR